MDEAVDLVAPRTGATCAPVHGSLRAGPSLLALDRWTKSSEVASARSHEYTPATERGPKGMHHAFDVSLSRTASNLVRHLRFQGGVLSTPTPLGPDRILQPWPENGSLRKLKSSSRSRPSPCGPSLTPPPPCGGDHHVLPPQLRLHDQLARMPAVALIDEGPLAPCRVGFDTRRTADSLGPATAAFTLNLVAMCSAMALGGRCRRAQDRTPSNCRARSGTATPCPSPSRRPAP